MVEVADQRARDGVAAEPASRDVAQILLLEQSFDGFGQRSELGVDPFDHVPRPPRGGDAVLLPEHDVDALPQSVNLARCSHQRDSALGDCDGEANFSFLQLWISPDRPRDFARRVDHVGFDRLVDDVLRRVSVTALVQPSLPYGVVVYRDVYVALREVGADGGGSEDFHLRVGVQLASDEGLDVPDRGHAIGYITLPERRRLVQYIDVVRED